MPIKGAGLEDIAWFLPEGTEMEDSHWQNDFARSLAVFLNGQGIRSLNDDGTKVVDQSFYIMFNAFWEPIEYTLPPMKYSKRWVKVLDTAFETIERSEEFEAEQKVKVGPRSIVVLMATEKI